MFIRVALLLILAGSAGVVEADDRRSITAFAPLSAHPILASWSCGTGVLRSTPVACGRRQPALDLQMARGGARGGQARGGMRGGGVQAGRGKGPPQKTERDDDDDDWGARRGGGGAVATPKEDSGSIGVGRGKKTLNQLLMRKSSSAPPAGGGSIGIKMQDFDPKKMERGSVRFLGSFDSDPPRMGLPEVAFVGRSNVGKSSMLNCLTNSKIAVTSKTPGRTQRVNVFAWKESKKAGRVVAMVFYRSICLSLYRWHVSLQCKHLPAPRLPPFHFPFTLNLC